MLYFIEKISRVICTGINTLCKLKIFSQYVSDPAKCNHDQTEEKNHCWNNWWYHLVMHLINFQDNPNLINRQLPIIGTYHHIRQRSIISGKIRENYHVNRFEFWTRQTVRTSTNSTSIQEFCITYHLIPIM